MSISHVRNKIRTLQSRASDANIAYYDGQIKTILDELAREVDDLEDRVETLEKNQIA